MKKLVGILMLLLMAGALMGCEKQEDSKELEIREYREEKFEGEDFVLENDYLLLELDKATTKFKVTVKSTGKVWYSTIHDEAADGAATGTIKKQLQSNIVLKYTTETGTQPILNSQEHSVENGYYTLEKTDDAIRILYTIGVIKKTYVIPIAVPEERFNEFYDKMDRSSQKKLDDAYRIIDWNSLMPTDDKSELLAKYPDIETKNVVILRDSTKDYIKERAEGWFAEAGYTREDYDKDLEYYPAATTSDTPQVNLTLELRLNGNQLVVEIPNEEIEFKKEYSIGVISVLPYFGSGNTQDEGYLFVPEGSGAIINFNNGKVAQSAYYAQMYGYDYGNKINVMVDETRVAFPVFGIANNDASFVCVIDESAPTANIEADISGKNHSYNSAYVSYDMIHFSEMDISGKSDSKVYAFEKELPAGKIRQIYTFLDSTDYVDMAKAYREYLTGKYPELVKNTDTELPVNVEFIAAVERVKQILGVPVKRPDVLTSFKDAKKILEEMTGAGYSNLSVRYTGWMNGGLEHSIPKNIKLTSGMGGKSALNSLVSYAKSSGIDLYLSGHVENVYDSDIFDGYIKSRDVAKYLSREAVEIPTFSFIYFSDINKSRAQHHFLVRPSVCADLIKSMADYAKKTGTGVGYEDVGYLLSGDYNLKRLVSRADSARMQTEALAKVKAEGTKILLPAGNQYVLPYVDLITDMALEGKNYLILDYQIPFYQIAIHGLTSYTGSAMNLSGDPEQVLLKSAESGAGLNFTYFAASSDVLQDTEYMEFYGADYSRWKKIGLEYYERYKKEMAGLNDQFITDHKFLSKDVTATTYENGTVVYVNYGVTDYAENGLKIPARDYLVERSGN